MISEKGTRAVLPPKREAMLIVPQCDNAGHDLSGLRRDIEAQLCNAFGGCTARDARGLWDYDGKLYDEPVTELVAACRADNRTETTLRRLANEVNQVGNQEATYCRFADGHVEIIPRNDKTQ